MQRVFGIPAGPLTVGVVALLAAAIAVVVALGLRNIVFVKLGLRNVNRRRGRSALIVVGLMLATTIIATALGTGDTMGATIRSSVFEGLGATDELVAVKGANLDNRYMVGGATGNDYFDEAALGRIRSVAAKHPELIDGVAPAIIESVAVQDRTSRSNEPRVTLFATASDLPAAFGDITGSDGRTLALADLGDGEVYLNRDAADALGARPTDDIVVFAAGRLIDLRVAEVADFRGAGTDSSAMLVSLQAAQEFLGQEGRARFVLVSNAGGESSGVAHTNAVIRLLRPTAGSLGLEVNPTKQDQLEIADQTGNAFMQMFTTFGSFSIVAGILLIFLIFVMLAAERRGEMGVARAVGTQRGHLVQSFVFEGTAYDLIAAAVGAAIGMAVSFGMVLAVGHLLATSGFDPVFAVRPRSFVLAYALGVLLTLVVVTVSAWRVSRLNIVTAIRNLPDPIVRERGHAHLARALVVLVVGLLLVAAGSASHAALPLLLGVSLLIIGLVPVARLLGVSDRIAYTTAGASLVVWWLLPFHVYELLVPDLRMDFSVWIVGGLMVVLGATWTVMNNADALLGLGEAVMGRVRSLAPVLRISMAHPLRNRLRTGMTLAMFTLVVFTLVVGATTSGSFIHSLDNVDRFGGGFDVRASASPLSPVVDMATAVQHVPGVPDGSVQAVASQSTLAIQARQAGVGRTYSDYVVRGVDDTFLDTTTYGFAATATGFDSAAAVWAALRDNPTYAVVDATVAPRRQNWGFGPPPDFTLTGFWLDDGVFDPIPVEMRDPQTGFAMQLTVIGVIRSDAPLEMAGLMTSQRALAPFSDRATPTVHYYKLADGTDASAFAASLESAFLANGLQAESFEKVLGDAVGGSLTFNWLIFGFMGLGLVVGVAALGVISARSVVERRQQIGVLRAIGFQPGTVQLGFLAEAAFVSLTAIVIGSVLGLVMAWNVVADAARKADWATVSFQMPWLVLAVVFVGVFVAALATTLLPARNASRVLPSEALRYQ